MTTAKGAVLASVGAAAGVLLLTGVIALSSSSSSAQWLQPPLPAADAADAPARALQANSLLPSLYLNYQDLPEGSKKSWFSTVDVTQSGLASFFAVQRTQFGYLGIQQTLTLAGQLQSLLSMKFSSAAGDVWYGLVIFSAWNTQGMDCQVEAIGEGFYQDRFTGEGTGCQIKGSVAWGADQYDFITTTEMMSNGRLKLSGYWEDRHDGIKWEFVGAISISAQGREFGEGGLATFIEQYLQSVDNDAKRMAIYGPQFIETESGSWEPIRVATFDTTETDVNAYYVAATTDASHKFFMGVSGTQPEGFDGNTPENTVLTLQRPGEASLTPALQGFIEERDQGTLPQGCTGVRVCGNGFTKSVGDLMPSVPMQWILWLLIFLFCGSTIFTIFNCLRPGIMVPSSPSRSLLRAP